MPKENKTRNLLTSLEDRKKEKRYCDFCSIIKSLFRKSGLEPKSHKIQHLLSTVLITPPKLVETDLVRKIEVLVTTMVLALQS